MIFVQIQECIEAIFCRENAAESFEPKFQIVPNVQVSDPEFRFARRGKLPGLS